MAPAKSKSQKRWAYAAYKRGEITRAEFEKFVHVRDEDLPERVKPKGKKKRRPRK